MAKKKSMSAEELVAASRKNKGRTPTKGFASLFRKKKKKEEKELMKGMRFE